MDAKINVALESGFAIGYDAVLAKVNDEVRLANGTHYLMARNGRGKTTLMRTIAGILAPKSGSCEISGNLQFIPEDITFPDFMTARQILKSIVNKGRYGECVQMANKLDLDIDKLFKSLSTGNQRKVSWLMAEFSMADAGQNVLLLDEPFTGLDSHAREIMMEYWAETEGEVCRLVSCHPDFDSMSIQSAVLITEGEIRVISGECAASWGELKDQLR